MVPASALSVVVFLLLVAPGICYELLQQRRHFPRQESAFVEVGRILLSGTLISALTLFLLALVRAWSHESVVDLPALLTQGLPYVSQHVTLVGWTASLELGTSTLLAVIFSDIRTSGSARTIQPIDPWHALAERYVKPGVKVNVKVKLKSGLEIAGRYASATTEPDLAKRELVLSEPISLRQPGSADELTWLSEWQALVVPGGEISYLAVQHFGVAQSPKPVRWHTSVGRWLVESRFSWQLAVPCLILLLVLAAVSG